MADAMQEMTYEEGDVICRQGDAGENTPEVLTSRPCIGSIIQVLTST